MILSKIQLNLISVAFIRNVVHVGSIRCSCADRIQIDTSAITLPPLWSTWFPMIFCSSGVKKSAWSCCRFWQSCLLDSGSELRRHCSLHRFSQVCFFCEIHGLILLFLLILFIILHSVLQLPQCIFSASSVLIRISHQVNFIYMHFLCITLNNLRKTVIYCVFIFNRCIIQVNLCVYCSSLFLNMWNSIQSQDMKFFSQGLACRSLAISFKN